MKPEEIEKFKKFLSEEAITNIRWLAEREQSIAVFSSNLIIGILAVVISAVLLPESLLILKYIFIIFLIGFIIWGVVQNYNMRQISNEFTKMIQKRIRWESEAIEKILNEMKDYPQP